MVKKSKEVFLEAYWPMLVGVFFFVFGCVYGPTFFKTSESFKWHIDNLYLAIFSFLVFLCPLIFASFIFIKTLENRFVSAIRKTIHFRRAEKFAWTAIIVSFFVSVATIPFMVIVPEPTERGVATYLTALWFGAVVYAVSLTVRSAYNIASILEVTDGERFKY